MFKFYLAILIIILLVNNIIASTSIDLSDNNPTVYCLKTVRKYSIEEVKEYLLRIQVPGEAEDYTIDDPLYTLCIEQNSKDIFD